MFANIVRRSVGVVCRRRSLLLKAVGYRLLSIAVTVAVAFVVLGDVSAALDVGVAANVVKMGVYYAYEEAWANAAVLRGLLPA